MKVLAITATRESIEFELDGRAQALSIRECVPTVGERPGRQLSFARAAADCRIARFDGTHDRIYSRFQLYEGDERLDGVQYVTDMADDVPEARYPYPQPAIIKALHGSPEDIRALGIRQSLYNINLPALMRAHEGEHTLPYEHDGQRFHFIKERVEQIDRHMKAMDEMGVLVTMILLNSPRLFGSAGEAALLDRVIHPNYDWDSPEAFISAFDMRTEDGQRHYRAFVEFLAERYTREDRKYGRAIGAIISNEVDSQYVWGNAGEMTVEEYTREYAQALRLAWICGRKHYQNFRVYLSLDHYWHGLAHKITQPLRYYPGRDVVEWLNRHIARDGNFDWHIAHHPYPENLMWPNFWTDRSPTFNYSTPRITFANMEMLPAYLEQPHLLYRGRPRRIIFSEQGFNSMNGPLAEVSEAMGEAGYVLAYLKARALPTVDMLTHHAYVDNPREFGLNLGIRRYDADKPGCAGEPKPIYYAIRDMDSEREPERIEKARAYIGGALFDALLHPTIIRGERDDSLDTAFG